MHIFTLTYIFAILSTQINCSTNSTHKNLLDLNERSILFVKKSDSLNVIINKTKASEAYIFCKNNNYNISYCLLINMQIHSGKNRFYVWDFELNKAIDSGLVSHGCCDKIWSADDSSEKPIFSNVPESHCSSLGKYKIGNRGVSSWGIKVNYLIYGLEETNNNALKRDIVLHSWEEVSDVEIYPEGTVESWGCPAVSNAFMLRLDDRLQKSEKNVLLWIFN